MMLARCEIKIEGRADRRLRVIRVVSAGQPTTSGLPRQTDILSIRVNVSNGPTRDSRSAAK